MSDAILVAILGLTISSITTGAYALISLIKEVRKSRQEQTATEADNNLLEENSIIGGKILIVSDEQEK